MNEKIFGSSESPVAQAAWQAHNSTAKGKTWKRRPRFLIAGVLLLALVLLNFSRCSMNMHGTSRHHADHANEELQKQKQEDWKVPMDVHIMSKCPDALACLSKLVVPAMAQTSDKVNFTLSFIGTPTDPDDGVSCMHGPSECLGNIIELCAADLYPDPKIYLGFTLCMSKRYPEIPSRDVVQDCALEHGISFDKLNDCASRDEGSYGMDLLRTSVRHSANVNATTSCTVRLDEKERCVRDGGKWKQCEAGSSVNDLVDDIEKLWTKKNGKESDEHSRA